MSSQTTKTLNSYPEEKIQLRLEALDRIDKDDISVLDCFHGYGKLWTEVSKRSRKKITVLGIEIDKDKKSPFDVIYGDNEKIIPSLNLRKYDIIDVDAFGDAFHYIKNIHDRIPEGTVIIYTQITVGLGVMHKALIEQSIGWELYKKCKTLFMKRYTEIFEDGMHKIGVKTLFQIEKKRKLYGYLVKMC